MPYWPWEVVERDHELQNPTSEEKIRLLGDYVRVSTGSRVLDIACGTGGPARILARTYGCRIDGIEIRPAFADEARARAAAEGLDSLIAVETGDAAAAELEPERCDAALCLGATFVWGRMADAAAALRPAVRSDGFVAIGEPFWHHEPPEGNEHEGYVDLAATSRQLADAGFAVTGLIAASRDDWDRYRSLQWRAIEEWLAGSPAHPGADEVRSAHERRRSAYFEHERALLGWAVFIGRKP